MGDVRLQMGDVQAEVQGRCAGCRREMCRLQMGKVQAVGYWQKWLLGEGNVPDKILYGCASKPDT